WVRSRSRRALVDGVSHDGDPWGRLAELLGRWSLQTLPGLPPWQGGVAGLFGYDLCHHLERLPRPRFDEFEVPDVAVGLYDWVISFDHAARRAWLVSTGLPETEPSQRRRRARERLLSVQRWLSRPACAPPAPPGSTVTPAVAHPLPALPGL